MKITLSTLAGDVLPLDVPADIELENLKALAEAEVGIPAGDMVVSHGMQSLVDDKRPISELGVSEGDVLLVFKRSEQNSARTSVTRSSQQRNPASFQRAPSTSTDLPMDPEAVRQMLLADPAQRALLRHNNPRLADALEAGLDEFKQEVANIRRERAERELTRVRMLTADPFDPDAQRLIADHIRQENIDSNMEAAIEYHPESFGVVTMLYIDCRVNGHAVKAFVDSGAQSTIMSAACAERCEIMRLVDRRWAGVAKGVGTQDIIGRIHFVQVEIGNVFLGTNLAVLQDQSMDMILGLDMLRRHQCVVDLRRNCLVIGTTETETRFLPESEVPERMRTLGEGPRETSAASQNMDDNLAMQQAIENSQKDANLGSKTQATSVSRAKSKTSTSAPLIQEGSSTSAATDVQCNLVLDEKVINEIVGLGFQREDVVRELKLAEGNKNVAIGVLFAKSLSVRK